MFESLPGDDVVLEVPLLIASFLNGSSIYSENRLKESLPDDISSGVSFDISESILFFPIFIFILI